MMIAVIPNILSPEKPLSMRKLQLRTGKLILWSHTFVCKMITKLEKYCHIRNSKDLKIRQKNVKYEM